MPLDRLGTIVETDLTQPDLLATLVTTAGAVLGGAEDPRAAGNTIQFGYSWADLYKPTVGSLGSTPVNDGAHRQLGHPIGRSPSKAVATYKPRASAT